MSIIVFSNSKWLAHSVSSFYLRENEKRKIMENKSLKNSHALKMEKNAKLRDKNETTRASPSAWSILQRFLA